MKKFILFILVASMLCGAAAAREWYEGGTLHRATVEQYLKGESADVLATTADWVCSTVSDSEIQKLTMDDVKAASGAVAMCIITATEGITDMYGQKAGDMAILCMTQLKKDYPWLLTKY